MRKKRAIRKHYEPRISPLRENFEVLDWSSARAQRVRFEVLARSVPLAGKRLLDVGCGLGDLLGFLHERGLEVDYVGVDILEKMIRAAARQHPEGRFVCVDLFADRAPDEPPPAPQLRDGSFDVVFSSGTFNLNLGNNHEFLPRALARMFELSRQYVVFNLLHCRAATRYGHCVYHDPVAILGIVSAFHCRPRVIDDYLHNDFTVVCEKDAGGG